ncbi:MAG: hypothetical protein ACSLE8_07870 [Rhodococcus sp. (in: high G+C Gram-positive bacteria)]
MQVRLRDDQHAALRRVSALVGMAQSDVVRWVLDSGLAAIEQAHPEAKEEHRGNQG